ncbi:lipid II flippase MurJ [Shigella flexneri]
MATDAFFVAFKLPNLLRRIFAEGAFSRHSVPILAEYKSKQGENAARVFVSYVSGLLTLALAVVTVAGMLAAPSVIMVTALGFAAHSDKFALTSQLLKITFPYLADLPGVAGGERFLIRGTASRFRRLRQHCLTSA